MVLEMEKVIHTHLTKEKLLGKITGKCKGLILRKSRIPIDLCY